LYDDTRDYTHRFDALQMLRRYSMHNPQLLDHFQNPRNVGELPPPAVTAEVSNPACGDTLRLSVQWEGDRTAAAAFKCRGCTASVAAGSALTELLTGRSRQEAARLRSADVEAVLGGLPPESKHAAVLCIDALRAVLRASGVK
jgi:nitrogen fixation NifU-like protein